MQEYNTQIQELHAQNQNLMERKERLTYFLSSNDIQQYIKTKFNEYKLKKVSLRPDQGVLIETLIKNKFNIDDTINSCIKSVIDPGKKGT